MSDRDPMLVAHNESVLWTSRVHDKENQQRHSPSSRSKLLSTRLSPDTKDTLQQSDNTKSPHFSSHPTSLSPVGKVKSSRRTLRQSLPLTRTARNITSVNTEMDSLATSTANESALSRCPGNKARLPSKGQAALPLLNNTTLPQTSLYHRRAISAPQLLQQVLLQKCSSSSTKENAVNSQNILGLESALANVIINDPAVESLRESPGRESIAVSDITFGSAFDSDEDDEQEGKKPVMKALAMQRSHSEPQSRRWSGQSNEDVWDADFEEVEGNIVVPTQIRESQAMVQHHLDNVHLFAVLVEGRG